jgi:cytochrome c
MTSPCKRSWTPVKRALLLASLGVGLLFGVTANSMAAPKAQALKNGEMLARENCASCHATTEKGESPNTKAPPFRTLSKRYKLDDLEESLAEGITIGHGNANMPHFIFEPEDIGDLIAYLKKLNRL